MDSVAIVGVGLIGGSFALSLREAGFRGEIVGVSSAPTLAKADGIVDRGVTIGEAAECDLIFLSQPIRQILDRLPRLAGCQSIVTDAGSTKRVICEAARDIPNFIGGHPMAGKEVSGVENAEAGLFRGRPWILTSEPPAELRHWLEAIGAGIRVLTPADHDRLVALASHMPQLVSSALARASSNTRDLAGPGLASMTRLAHSPYAVWKDILETNRDGAIAALDEFLAEASSLRAALQAKNFDAVSRYFDQD